MNEICVSVKDLRMTYGHADALRGVSFDLEAGSLVGLAGANGSGKTTLLKILAGLIQTFRGGVSILGQKDTWAAKADVCFHPAYPWFRPGERLSDALKMYARLRLNYRADEAAALFDRFGFDMNARLGTLSKGRCALALFILSMGTDARVYLLDEPFGGIDVKTRDEMKEVLLRLADGDRLFLIATHELSDMERLFDRFILLKEGRVALDGLGDDLREAYGCSVTELARRML